MALGEFMLRLIVMAIAAVALIAALVLGALWSEPRTAIPASDERLTNEDMAALVRAPLRLIEAGDVAGGQRLFERSVAIAAARHGPGALEVADLLMSFGAMIYRANDEEVPQKTALATLYLRRAVPAYRAALGPNHPDVATALNSHADVLRLAEPDDPPAEAERALNHAYRIRLASRGPHHAETLWTLLYIAEIHAAPGRTRGDPARIAAVRAELDRALRLSRSADADTAAEIRRAVDQRRADLQDPDRTPDSKAQWQPF
jgi:hypothetical protein